MSTERIDQMYPDEHSAPDNVSTKSSHNTQSETHDEFGYEHPAEPLTGNPYSLEPDSTDEKLYGAESKVVLSEETDLSIIGSTSEEQTNLSQNLGYMAHEVGASQNDIHDLVTNANKLVITGEVPDPAATMFSLYEQHGESLNQKLNDAQTLISSFSDVSEWLNKTGAGDSEAIINQVIRIAQTPRSQSRIQKLRNKKNEL